MRSAALLMAAAATALATDAAAHEPFAYPPATYALDALAAHPYTFVPAYGHASQNPGSPRWFQPGYGYAVPGFGAFGPNVFTRNYPSPGHDSYGTYYAFGRRRAGFGASAINPYPSYPYGGPWFYPGASTNLGVRLGDGAWIPQ